MGSAVSVTGLQFNPPRVGEDARAVRTLARGATARCAPPPLDPLPTRGRGVDAHRAGSASPEGAGDVVDGGRSSAMKTRLIGFAAAVALTGAAAILTAPSLAQPQPPPAATRPPLRPSRSSSGRRG